VEALFSQSANNIIRLPTQDYIDLAAIYQSADLAVFPAQCSMSFYDVQACGVPVLLERIEVNVSRTRHGNGLTFNPGDVTDLRNKIMQFAEMDRADAAAFSCNSRRFVMENYDFAPIAKKITEIMEIEVQRFRGRTGAC
jgi:glycosyltransferase involved in cell wall biosynthesis